MNKPNEGLLLEKLYGELKHGGPSVFKKVEGDKIILDGHALAIRLEEHGCWVIGTKNGDYKLDDLFFKPSREELDWFFTEYNSDSFAILSHSNIGVTLAEVCLNELEKGPEIRLVGIQKGMGQFVMPVRTIYCTWDELYENFSGREPNLVKMIRQWDNNFKLESIGADQKMPGAIIMLVLVDVLEDKRQTVIRYSEAACLAYVRRRRYLLERENGVYVELASANDAEKHLSFKNLDLTAAERIAADPTIERLLVVTVGEGVFNIGDSIVQRDKSGKSCALIVEDSTSLKPMTGIGTKKD